MPRRVNLIPMAGAGKRFADAGYSIPKPMISVGGVPMVVKAAECLPAADEWIFICRREHDQEANLSTLLAHHFHPVRVLPLDRSTEGQAVTCLKAAPFLRCDDVLTIGACDNAMCYDRNMMSECLMDERVDAFIWTFRHNPAVLQNPRMYGWVVVDKKGNVQRVSCKVPVSPLPMDDHAIIGAFTFKRAGDFLRCAEVMIRADRRVNGEFYVDELMNVALESGSCVRVFEVNTYICWGTPTDLRTYEYWRRYFLQSGPDQECPHQGDRDA